MLIWTYISISKNKMNKTHQHISQSFIIYNLHVWTVWQWNFTMHCSPRYTKWMMNVNKLNKYQSTNIDRWEKLIFNLVNVQPCPFRKKNMPLLGQGHQIQISSFYWTCSAVGNVSDCRFRDCEFVPGPVPYFQGDWSFSSLLLIQEGLLSITSESKCQKYWLTP